MFGLKLSTILDHDFSLKSSPSLPQMPSSVGALELPPDAEMLHIRHLDLLAASPSASSPSKKSSSSSSSSSASPDSPLSDHHHHSSSHPQHMPPPPPPKSSSRNKERITTASSFVPAPPPLDYVNRKESFLDLLTSGIEHVLSLSLDLCVLQCFEFRPP